MTRDAASLAQLRASDPQNSTWLAANAGSGKTSVLTDRVARLLLGHADPASILCLTYTKAAASEMQNRLFRRLGEWAMQDDAALTAGLRRLGLDHALAAGDLNHARRLFARAIETPGGLRIQTIHSFCAGLLRRFPMEAGVSPRFTEMEDRAASLLRAEVVEEMAGGPQADTVAALAGQVGDEELESLIQQIAAKRAGFANPLGRAECLSLFGLPPDMTMAGILDQVFLGDEGDWLPLVVAQMARGKTTDQRVADALGRVNAETPDEDALVTLEGACLTGAGAQAPFSAKIDAIPTKDLRARMGAELDRFNALMHRVEAARPLHVALKAAEQTHVLHRFASAFLPEYEARKAARGALDFDDLIARARDLLSAPAVAPWVLYRLDGGIRHILVDEAQDTSPDQWKIVELLAGEIMAGSETDDRTIFVVGDRKQSIYSFQGADADDFGRMQTLFSERLSAPGQVLATLTLEHSFRSSPLILQAVDAALQTESSVTALGGSFRHRAFREAMPGRIELWPPFLKETAPEPEDWADPVDLLHPEHHALRLARRIAERINEILSADTQIPTKDGGTRQLTAGDILILVRRRSDLFAEIIRALKQAGLPVAGADRLKLGGELAVKDLAALLAFLATPEDDLSLAAALRSPLFGWTEAQVFDLAHDRPGYLWEALRAQADRHPETLAALGDLRDQTDFLRPFDLIERLLTRHDGRRRLLARLGAEAEDGIDALLAQALSYEQSEVPSLTGFLTWLQTEDVEIKRRPDSSGGLIRVMTVHGAKGLEAPVVILPDTADRKLQDRDHLIALEDGPLVWKTRKDESPEVVLQAAETRKAAAQRESLRLLYVAMTRAQSWLIVAAAGGLKSHGSGAEGDTEGEAWYDLIKAGLGSVGAVATGEGGLEARFGDWPEPALPEADAPELPQTLPAFAVTPAPKADQPQKPLSPSGLGGAKVLPGDPGGDGAAARQRGTDLHRLLEHLPGTDPALWPGLAAALIPDPDLCAAALTAAQRLLTDPALAHVFSPGTLAEVAITADLDGAPMLGSIDRLIVAPDHVLAVDFKSNLLEPETPGQVPDGLIRQLRAYVGALRQIYPDRRVGAAILWTGSARLMTVPDL